ncbi:MAG TPA: DUF3105 domain-containing protein [Acidimicrobiia bacterium]|jgi:hypothetical protein
MAGGQGGRPKPPVSRRKPPISKPKAKAAIRRNAVLGVVAVLFVALLGVCLADRTKDKEVQDKLVAQLTAGDCSYDTKADSGSDHVENPPPYKMDPPAGGDHTPQAASAGVYREGQVPPDGPIVHAMEHGFVVIWYRPGDPESMNEAEALGDEFSEETLVVPRASLDVPVAATAWHRRLLCKSFEEETLKKFIRAYRDQGPEKGFLS